MQCMGEHTSVVTRTEEWEHILKSHLTAICLYFTQYLAKDTLSSYHMECMYVYGFV